MGSPQSGCTNTQLHWQSTGALFSSHAFQHLVSLVFFNDGHTNRHVVTSLWGFDLHFPDVSDVDHLFKYLLAICMYSLSKKVYSGLLSTLIELFVFCSMLYEFMGYMSFWFIWVSKYILDIKPTYIYIGLYIHIYICIYIYTHIYICIYI